MSTELALSVTNDLPMIFELAKQLVPTGMLPSHIRQPGQAVAIILAGRELGMPPMRALRSLALVEGKVVEAADSQLGRFKAAGGTAHFEKLDDTEAVLRMKHPNGDEHVESFTIEQAKRAGLTGKAVWQKYPRAMLRSRVITAGLKSIGWDGAVGEYDPEEAEEIGKRPAPTLVSVGATSEPTVVMPRRKSEAVSLTAPDAPAPTEAEMAADSALHAQIAEAALADNPEPEEGDDIEALLDASIANAKAKHDEPISQKQLERLFAIARKSGHDDDAVKTWLKDSQGFASRKAITTSQYDAICRRLEDPTQLLPAALEVEP